ncbi:MAG: hypothetical protein JWO03_2172 [Bacteroidetes bacterium]|nr:hypothetical protein [Bacteroidota bacterium]
MEEINIPSTLPQDTSFVSDPYFLIVAVAVLIIFAVSVKLFFTNTHPEYVYNPQMD